MIDQVYQSYFYYYYYLLQKNHSYPQIAKVDDLGR